MQPVDIDTLQKIACADGTNPEAPPKAERLAARAAIRSMVAGPFSHIALTRQLGSVVVGLTDEAGRVGFYPADWAEL